MNNIIFKIEKMVPVPIVDKEAFFMNEAGQIQPLVEKVKAHYQNLVIDGSTEDGRKELKKLGAEINKVVELIDSHGKEIVDILKAKPKQIDAGRKLIKDQLAQLRAELIKPLTDYEAEQKRIKEEEQAIIGEEQRKKDAELADLRAEKERAEREAKIADDAAKKASFEAENKVKAAELALQQEREETERKEKQRIEDENRKERERLAEEKRKADAEAKRLADINHVRTIKFAAYQAFTNSGVSDDVAKIIILLISDGKIPNVSINF